MQRQCTHRRRGVELFIWKCILHHLGIFLRYISNSSFFLPFSNWRFLLSPFFTFSYLPFLFFHLMWQLSCVHLSVLFGASPVFLRLLPLYICIFVLFFHIHLPVHVFLVWPLPPKNPVTYMYLFIHSFIDFYKTWHGTALPTALAFGTKTLIFCVSGTICDRCACKKYKWLSRKCLWAGVIKE